MKTQIYPLKIVAIFFICLGVQQLKGQSLLDLKKNYYEHFDSTKISTSILIDRSPNFSSISFDYDDVDTFITNTHSWRQGYLDLINGQYNNQKTKNFPFTLLTLDNTIETFRVSKIQPLGLILKKFNTIRDSSYLNGEIYFDSIANQYDFINFPYNHLDEGIYFNCSSMIPYIDNDTINITINEDFIYSDFEIDNIRIAIAETKTNTTILPNEILSIPIGELNNDIIDFTITVTLQVNSRLYRSSFQLKRLFPVTNPDIIQYNFNTPGACNLIAPKGYAEARAYVVWSNPFANQIKKPLILVEGYDPSPMNYGAIGWRTLSEGKSYDEYGNSVYQQLAKMPDLATALTEAGYDIIFVDFKESGADIEKNAATLAKIIQWVNYIKVEDNEPVLMGASLGGILCQTALNILEKSNCKSCIDAFVSFDTPFLGANVPLGIQELVKFGATSLELAQTQYHYKLNTDAAKQLLFYHIEGINIGRDWHNKFSSFNKRIANRNICFTSGIAGNSTLGIGDGDELISWEIYNKINLKEYVDLHIYSMNRFNNMTLQVKVPTEFVKVKILGKEPKIVGVKNYVSTTKYTPNELLGSPNYDNYSGGTANYINEVFEILVKKNTEYTNSVLGKNGPFAPKGDWHCFVPTHSALDIATNDPTIDLTAISKDEPSEIHPFDFIRFAPKNQNHVMITDANISDLILALESGQQKISGIVTQNFNSCQAKFTSFNSLTILSNVVVSFNDYKLSNYGSSATDIFPKYNKIYARSSNCEAHVVCESNSSLVIGGYNLSSQALKAQVEFRKGSTLELHPESVLRIRDNSTLIIEEGATLIYHPGAKIYLEGENAVLEIRGTVQLQNDAVFGFEKGNAVKGGFVRFNFSDNDPNHIKAMGPNCKISLLGETYFTDKVLEIANGTKLILPYLLNTNSIELAEFRVIDGGIDYFDGASIDAGCATHLKNVTFTQYGDKLGTGLITHGQANLVLEECHFNELMLGMKALNNDLNNALSITNNRFFNCNDGLHAIGQNVRVEVGSISNCGFGLILEGTQDARIEGTEFLYNAFGLETRGSNAHIRIEDAWFLKNSVFGVFDLQETRFTMSCTPFEENGTGFYTNGKVNMSPIFMFPGQTLGGGNNTFFNNQVAMEFQTGEVQLKNGGNNFIVPSTFVGPPNFLLGSLTASAFYIPNNLLDISGNYFSNLPPGGISAGNGTLYSLTSFGGLSPNGATVLLNGTPLPAMNTLCFSFPRIYPNSKKAYEFTPEEYEFEKEYALKMLKVYPNPTSDIITLEGLSTVNGVRDLVLFDMQGKEIYQSKWAIIPGTNRLQLPLKALVEPGVYMLKVIGSDGSSQVIRISLSY